MFYVYALVSNLDGQFYIGYTSDLRKRFAEHNNGQSRSTRKRGRFVLVYYEASSNKYDALARERYLKSGMGRRYLKNRLKNAFSN